MQACCEAHFTQQLCCRTQTTKVTQVNGDVIFILQEAAYSIVNPLLGHIALDELSSAGPPGSMQGGWGWGGGREGDGRGVRGVERGP